MIIYTDMKDFFSKLTSEVEDKINLPVAIPPPPPPKKNPPHSNALLYIKKSIINDCIHTCMARQKSLRSREMA